MALHSFYVSFGRVIAAVLAVALLALAASPADAQFKRVDRTIKVGKLDRSYHAFIPESAGNGREISVLFAFHPLFGSGEGMIDQMAIHRVSGADNFIVVYPEGFRRSWNTLDCCGPAMRRNIDDIGFVKAMLEDLKQFGNISASRNFAAGFSNGFAFSQELACQLPDRFAAIAGGGAMRDTTRACSGAKPISVFVMHGQQDPLSPFDGRKGSPDTGATEVSMATVEAFWSRINRCGNARTVTKLGDVACSSHTGCSSGTEVTICLVPGMGHWWPGTSGKRMTERKLGPARGDLNGSAEVVSFFRSKL